MEVFLGKTQGGESVEQARSMVAGNVCADRFWQTNRSEITADLFGWMVDEPNC
jgi:hypothetical protein